MAKMTRQEYIAYRETVEEQAAGIHMKAVEHCREVFKPEQYGSFLSFAARWRHYSPVNILLLHMQRPDAEFIGDYRTWRWLAVEQGYSLNYTVIPEEEKNKGIVILAPIVLTAVDDTSIQELAYKTVIMFDISQTDRIRKPEMQPHAYSIMNLEFKVFIECLKYTFRNILSFTAGGPDDKYFRFGGAYLRGNAITYRDDIPESARREAVLKELARFFVYRECGDNPEREFIFCSVLYLLSVSFKPKGLPHIPKTETQNPSDLYILLNSVCSIAVSIIEDLSDAYQHFLEIYSDGRTEKGALTFEEAAITRQALKTDNKDEAISALIRLKDHTEQPALSSCTDKLIKKMIRLSPKDIGQIHQDIRSSRLHPSVPYGL